ncbi:hypothetical protein FC81_GL000043 [Liquorilactobacillus capillatus DSM 19910]|uniref:LysM domain-containing protein n=2 Tax=Liquorilactobacillus capillatus TaxID=480931 RepID=A0A0R1M5X5_9LACO|nr:hypothetical protein FC81_GL000043 [Liquorilactobacillus capillatus DSM 19910]
MWSIAVIMIILVLGFLGWKNENIRARLNSSFSDNKSAQKAEYKKQQSIAKKKYGTEQSSEQADKTSAKSSSKEEASETAKTASNSEKTTTTKSSTNKAKAHQTYIVKYGDSLTIIAEKYHTTPTKLMKLNNLDNGTINPGAKLIVPSTKGTTATSANTDDE